MLEIIIICQKKAFYRNSSQFFLNILKNLPIFTER